MDKNKQVTSSRKWTPKWKHVHPLDIEILQTVELLAELFQNGYRLTGKNTPPLSPSTNFQCFMGCQPYGTSVHIFNRCCSNLFSEIEHRIVQTYSFSNQPPSSIKIVRPQNIFFRTILSNATPMIGGTIQSLGFLDNWAFLTSPKLGEQGDVQLEKCPTTHQPVKTRWCLPKMVIFNATSRSNISVPRSCFWLRQVASASLLASANQDPGTAVRLVRTSCVCLV